MAVDKEEDEGSVDRDAVIYAYLFRISRKVRGRKRVKYTDAI